MLLLPFVRFWGSLPMSWVALVTSIRQSPEPPGPHCAHVLLAAAALSSDFSFNELSGKAREVFKMFIS
jgi:hypothetical protein